YIQFESATSIGGNEFLPLLLEAIQRKKQVWFLYTSYIKAEEKPRKVSPLFLKEYRNRWYLISFNAKQKEIRTYALDRMDTPKLLEEETHYPGDFDAENYFKHSMGITSYKGKSSKIILKANTIAARYISSQPIHESQEIEEETKEFSLFVLTLLISEELIRTILSYGGEIEILEPIELRKVIQERISGMNKLYKVN
ncbi:MAG: WYL domain-containing protein, partial [Flavobacteriales bacterium]|nr:WYL domain-containing protein [Flavobacteriales bacterium]